MHACQGFLVTIFIPVGGFVIFATGLFWKFTAHPPRSVFDLLTFYILWFVLDADSVAQKTLFQSGGFLEGLMTQTMKVVYLRRYAWQ
jgi:hypothetical protein